MAALADNLIVHAKWPLKWLWQACERGGSIPRRFDDDRYDAAWQLSNLSLEYLNFESVFTYAGFGLLTLALDGSRITTSGPMREDSRFEAYDRFTGNPLITSSDPAAQSFLERLAASVRVRGHSFKYDLNPRVIQEGMESLGHLIDERFSLPSDWELPRFSMHQFARVAKVLWILAMIHFNARTVAALKGCEGLGFANALILMERTEIVMRLRRYSGVDEQVVSAIVEDLTYGSREQANPDPALQPLVPLNQSLLAISPNLVINSSMERNLSVLLNRLPEERGAYAALSQEKERRSRIRICNGLDGKGFRFWHGRVPEWGAASDIDLAIISDGERQCLLLELKSFIAPAEPREICERSEEIRRGIEQIRNRIEQARILPKPLQSVLGIDSEYQLTWAVASENSIGAGYVQSPEVPVVNIRHLLRRLQRNPDLVTCSSWITKRDYLPTKGLHYKEIAVEAKLGRWILEWFGLTDFADGFI